MIVITKKKTVRAIFIKTKPHSLKHTPHKLCAIVGTVMLKDK